MATTQVGKYLFERLGELGIRTVFGVPGDYELALLDLAYTDKLRFSGNPNELVASYAADGYARIAGVGAFVTTFGPGELSAYCGQAGSFTEFVPVVHIVGYPGRDAMQSHAIMHHSLGDGRFDMYHKMAKEISCATTILMDPKTAPAEIDRCLQTMLDESRPCYIGIPVDVSHLECDAVMKPLKALAHTTAIDEVTTRLVEILKHSKSPVVIMDGLCIRSGAVEEARRFADVTGIATFITCMGKSAADETRPNFGGLYAGAGSTEGVQEMVESSDAMFWLGRFSSDFNTGEFTETINEKNVIDFQRTHITIQGQRYEVGMKPLLQALAKALEGYARPTLALKPYPALDLSGKSLTQDQLWDAVGKWLKSGDLVITETGTSAYGICVAPFAAGVDAYSQTVFGSIGYATGAAVGSFQASKERGSHKRSILITGEGSLHMTIQAFMDMLKLELKPIIFILNNNGYTIERLIHGKEAHYNTLPLLDYSKIASTFGPGHKSAYHGPIGTVQELEQLLRGEALLENALHVVELTLGYLDAPAFVKKAGAFVEMFNAKQDGSGKILDTGRSVLVG